MECMPCNMARDICNRRCVDLVFVAPMKSSTNTSKSVVDLSSLVSISFGGPEVFVVAEGIVLHPVLFPSLSRKREGSHTSPSAGC